MGTFSMIGLYAIYFLTSILIFFYFYSTRKYNYWKQRNVFYIKPVPFFGNMLPIITLKESIGEWLARLSHNTNLDYFGIFLYDQPVLVANSPKLVKSILQKDFSYFQDRTVVTPDDPVISNLMFFSTNPKWKTIRSKMTPVFTSGKLKLMFSLVLGECQAMTDYIGTLANVANVESKEICAKYSTNVIARCAFAVDAQSFKNPNAEFRNIGRLMFDFRYTTAFRQLGAFFTPNLIKIFKINFFDPPSIERLTEIFTEVLHTRMHSNLANKGNDLVDILLEAGEKDMSEFSENILVAQALQFFLAGFETVSATLSFTFYELCIAPKIQEKLRTEIEENIKKHNGITYEGVAEMLYLDMCVSETLRKYPVLPFLDRMCKQDYKVEGSDLIIKKGTPVYIPMYGLHYNPKYFPDPHKYDPERFLDKTKINNDGLYYIPFGDGPRICIGNRFGLMTVKLGLIGVLSKFILEKSDKTPVPIVLEKKSLLLQSTVGIPLKFVPI